MHVCIIGGFPRSGTRQFNDILNEHPDVLIHNEVHSKTFEKVGELFAQVDADHSGHWTHRHFKRRRTRVILATLAGVGKGRRPRIAAKRAVVGFKTPWIENDEATLRGLFGEEHPTFYYCVRNLHDNYLSARAVLVTNAKSYAQRACQSLRAALAMMDDPAFALRVLSLDAFLGSQDRGAWISENLFAPLPVETPSAERASEWLSNTSNRNASARKLGKARPTTIDPEELRVLTGHKDLERVTAEFRERTGIDVYGALNDPPGGG